MPTPNEIFQQLLQSGALPKTYNMTDSGGNITRFSDIKQEYDEGACGPLPFIVSAHRKIQQTPRSAPYRVLAGGTPDLGVDEIRPNTRRRFTGGDVPNKNQLLLHLIADDLASSQRDDSAITVTWKDSSGNNIDVAAPDSDAAAKFNLGESGLGGFSSISFDDERAYFEYNGNPTNLQTLANKSIYMVMQYSIGNVSSADEGHPIVVSGSSIQDDLIVDKYQSYVINIDSQVSYFRSVSRTAKTDNMVEANPPGSDVGIIAVDAGKIIESTDIAEIIIYNTVHDSAQNLEVFRYLHCKYSLPDVEQQSEL